MATRLAAQRSNFGNNVPTVVVAASQTVTMSSSSSPPVASSVASSSSAAAINPVLTTSSSPPQVPVIGNKNSENILSLTNARTVMINGNPANVNGNILLLEEDDEHCPNEETTTAIPISLQHVGPQKKLVLHATTTDGMSVIDVVPLKHSDSDSDSPITVQMTDGSGDITEQQVTAQVAVLQAQAAAGGSGPHYITVTAVAAQDGVGGHHGAPAYHVQYVESNAVYGANSQQQTQMSYPLYTVEDYATTGQQYYATTEGQQQSAAANGVYNGGGGGSSSAGGGGTSSSRGGQALSSPDTSQQQHFLVDTDVLLHTDSNGESTVQATSSTHDSPGGYGSSSGIQSGAHDGGSGGEQASTNLSHATRVSPATVAWLMENYETAEGVSLPRSTLYNHYMRHCNEHKLDAVNAASFGKLIRSVFTGLRTRRLGTRGNSKYHYYGIRVKPSSSLIGAMDEQESQGGNSSGGGAGVTAPTSTSSGIGGVGGKGTGQGLTLNNGSSSNHGSAGAAQSGRGNGSKKSNMKPIETFEQCAQFLGDGGGAIPLFPHIDTSACEPGMFGDEISLEDVDTLRSMYREHCEAFLDAVLNLEFGTVESLWREFWRLRDDTATTLGEECEEEKYLSKAKLFRLCQLEGVQNFIRQVDFAFYQNLVEILIPDVLRPIPSTLTQAIRNFAKNLENWLTISMAECPTAMVQIKLSAVSAFSQTLRRYTSLNHLAQAARAVLQNSSQINQMLNDLNRVDFHNVQEQASWVCQCDLSLVERLENDFKVALQQQNTLEQWAAWLRLVVESALEEYYGKKNFVKAARQFLLKWSFYSSMVIRDLTLRSAASFGSFHLIRLLYDEYMFFIVEHKVAQATHTAPIAVMTECVQPQPVQEEEMTLIFTENFVETKDHQPPAKRMKS